MNWFRFMLNLTAPRRLITVLLVFLCVFSLSGCSLLAAFPGLGLPNEATDDTAFLPVAESPDLSTDPDLLAPTDPLSDLLAEATGHANTAPTDAAIHPMKAVWISYLEFDRILKGKPESAYRDQLTRMMQHLQDNGFDTVFVQVRSHGDAYYPSAWFPWSAYASGTTGSACSFDPFALLIEAAASHNIAVHAWLNLFRLMPEADLSTLSPDYLLRQWYDDPEQDHPQLAQADNGTFYLNPNHPEVQELILHGVEELTASYPIAGIHVDDYFYDRLKPSAFSDTTAQGREAVSSLIKQIYQTVKQADPTLLFGVSPAGNIKAGSPVSDRTQLTDLVRWTREDGYLDYIAPQIYWDDDDPVAPFGEILEGWISFMEPSDKTLYVGLAGYKFAKDERLSHQMADLAQHQAVSGMIIFRYDSIATKSPP